MSRVYDEYFSGVRELRSIDLTELVKGKENYLGSGFFSDVYEVQDNKGNRAPDYVFKVLSKSMFVDRFFLNIRRKIGDIKSESSLSLDPNFRSEVAALVDLKGQQIGPNIVYANYKKYYYVIEKMDDTLKGLIERNELTPSHVMKLLALGDRYLLSKYFHDDMHTNNIMWSDKLNDFRIIDWGIYLIIKPESTPSTTIKKINGVFQENIILYASLYTQLKIEEGGDKVEQWKAIADKISGYIETKYPERKTKYDVFDSGFKYKKNARGGIDYFKDMQLKYQNKKTKQTKKNKGGRRKKPRTRKKKSRKS